MLLSMTMKPLICGNLKPQVYFRQDQPIGVFFFIGSITFEWAPGKCKTFVWLAIRNRCWTTDRLQKRGLPHPEHCPLCDQEEENIQHILISCVFARQFWYAILQPINLSRLTPTRSVNNFPDWWKHAERRLPKQHRKGFNSLCTWGLDPLEA